MKLHVQMHHSERTNTNYYRYFTVVDSLPEEGEEITDEGKIVTKVYEESVDCDQGCQDNYNYDYYRIEKELHRLEEDGNDDYDCLSVDYIAIEKRSDEDEDEESIEWRKDCEERKKIAHQEMIERQNNRIAEVKSMANILTVEEIQTIKNAIANNPMMTIHKSIPNRNDFNSLKPIKERLSVTWNEFYSICVAVERGGK